MKIMMLTILFLAEPTAELHDPYLWLEEVEGAKPLEWVRARNKDSLAVIEADPRFQEFQNEIQTILEDKERIAYGDHHGPWVYNFWQDEDHVRGIWRRTTSENYRAGDSGWETILDVDQLAEKENENWVYKGEVPVSAGDFDRVMISLSRGGSDATVLREFDVPSRSFVEGGFELAEAKSRVAWLDRDTLLVGTDFGEGSLTTSGYPRLVKKWKRGTPLEQAETLFEGKAEDVSVDASCFDRAEGTTCIVTRATTFFTAEHFLMSADGSLAKLPLPNSSEVVEVFGGAIYALLRDPIERDGGATIKAGSLVRLPIAKMGNGPAAIESVLEPAERESIRTVSAGKEWLNLAMSDNVAGDVRRLRWKSGSVEIVRVQLPTNGTTSIVSTNPFDDDVFVDYSSPIEPQSLYALTGDEPASAERIKQLSAKFDATGLVVERRDATSKDGTKVPYFVVRREDTPMDGTTPTLLYGYGGFEISMLPYYSAGIGKLWLERGGAYALACIRGGGEFGPKWHQAALKENRQRAYDDFIAIAEDLIARKQTSPSHLGIMGASNGGLLVGATFVQRPDLFHAVVCGVPLLDMIRYTKLLAGASWMAEYGDPDDAQMRASILGYSPYQNVREGVDYPEVFFMTSTKDDRVHPGHARKMVAKMIDQGHPVLYFENIEGGHGAAANLKQRARRVALEFTYLHRKLD